MHSDWGGNAVLSFLTIRDATTLLVVSTALCALVKGHEWDDMHAAIPLRHVSKWRSRLPHAHGVTTEQTDPEYRDSESIYDDWFSHFTGLRRLHFNEAYCGISAAAIVHLAGIEELHLCGMEDLEVSDEAFRSLRGIRELHLYRFGESTEAGFAHLAGIQDLNIGTSAIGTREEACTPFTVTDVTLSHLAGIRRLNISRTRCIAVTNAGFTHWHSGTGHGRVQTARHR